MYMRLVGMFERKGKERKGKGGGGSETELPMSSTIYTG